MRELGQMRVGKAVLTSGAVGVEDHWLGGASQYPNVVAELFVTRLLKRRQSLVVVARNTGPGELPNVRGQDPWDYALASSSGQLSDRDGIFRSEERRVGKECVSRCRSRWAPSHKKKKK